MITTGPLESFFKSPNESPSDLGDGVLFHLRRNLEKLYGKEDDFDCDLSDHAFLAMMGILAGIDYLSKAYACSSNSRGRFVEILKDLCGMSDDSAQSLYQLRCALMHDISLSTVSKCSYKRDTRFIFEITDKNNAPLIEKQYDNGSEVTYRINFWGLKCLFLEMIDKLLATCNDLNSPKHSFVLNKVGQLHSEKIMKK